MTRSYNWRGDPKYRVRANHERAFMRPAVQALLTKLDSMKMIQDPGVPEEIIWRMAFHHLHRNGQYARLAQIAARLTHLWAGTAVQQELNPDDAKASIMRGLAINDQRIEAAESRRDFGDRPSIDLNSQALKSSVQSTLMLHVPEIGKPAWMIKCTCGREYAHAEEWSNHVRIRIWKLMKNEFPPIGTKETSNG